MSQILDNKVFCKTLPNYLDIVIQDMIPIYNNFQIDYTHPKSRVYNGQWDMIIMSMYHHKTKYAEQFKRTYELIMDNVADCHSIAVSVLRPGTVIKPHKGMDNNLFRGHLYFDVPDGCQFITEDTTKVLSNGDCFYFDDMVIHSANNKSDKPRYMIAFDFYKDPLKPHTELRDDMLAWIKQNDAGINNA